MSNTTIEDTEGVHLLRDGQGPTDAPATMAEWRERLEAFDIYAHDDFLEEDMMTGLLAFALYCEAIENTKVDVPPHGIVYTVTRDTRFDEKRKALHTALGALLDGGE